MKTIKRRLPRDIFNSIDKRQGAIVLTGPGGIGKSTLITRTAAELRRKGFEFIIVRGCTTVEQILEAIALKAESLGVDYAEKFFNAFDYPMEKLSWYLERFLLKQKTIIIFHHFEENQDEKKAGEFKQERLKKFLCTFKDRLKHHETFLLFSTRFPIPGFDAPEMTINIPGFSTPEFHKILLNSKALKQLDEKSPETLFRYLDKPQRKLLEVLAVYGNPVPEQALTAQHVIMEEQDRAKLEQLSLLHFIEAEEKKLYYLHRLTAQYLLNTMKGTEKKTYHCTAARYFAAIPMQQGKVYLHHRIEARRHYLRAKEWNQAAELTIDLTPYLMDRGYLVLAAELLRELEMKKLSEKNRAEVHNCLGNIHREFGEHQQALSQYSRALDIAKKTNELKGTSRYMYQRGNIYYKTGDYDPAFNQYSQALEISAKTGDYKGMADSLHQIGILYQFKDDYDAAFNNVNKSLEIKKKIGDSLGIGKSLLQMGMFYYYKRDYDAALARFRESKQEYGKIAHYRGVKGAASAWHWLGMVYQAKGDYDAALDNFHLANEELDTIADFKDMGYNFYRIGMIYNVKGDYDAALNNLSKAIEVFEKNKDGKNVSSSLHEMGKVYQNKGNDETALQYFLRAFRHFTGAGAPNQVPVSLREDIARVRGSLPEDRFNSILQEFNFPTDFFDNDEDREQEEFTEFLAALTREAAAAREKSSQEKKQLSARLDQLMEKLSDTREGRDLKSYFRLLRAIVNGKDYQEHLEEISLELKEFFQEIKEN